MDPEITDTVTEWESVAVESGHGGLQSLGADEFSGAVTAGTAWAFLLNGRIVGVFDGDVDDFEAADLTAYRTPDPALPLLFAMQETGGETRGRYYTEDTPLEEVDRTLSEGKFTGYVELSENVLSGDYYVVYHGGRSMSVAFVGTSRRLVTDEEAFELADDEVGIYEVTAVDIDVVDVPGETGHASGAVGGVATAAGDDDGDETDVVDEADEADVADVAGEADGADEAGDGEAMEDDPTVAAGEADDADSGETADDPTVAVDDADDSGGITLDDHDGAAVSDVSTVSVNPDERADSVVHVDTVDGSEGDDAGDDGDEDEEYDGDEDEEYDDAAADWEEPGEPADATPEVANGGSTEVTEAADDDGAEREGEPVESEFADGDSEEQSTADTSGQPTAVDADRDELAARVEDLEAELEEVTRERDRYRVRVADLESEVERLRESAERPAADENRASLSPATARDGTNLFVRYHSKGQPTLADAQAGDAKKADVVENLRLEYHTSFDSGIATVDGDDYETFLRETTEWGFVQWVVEDLLYEIGRSGHRSDLAALFDSIPDIDRIQFDGEVPVTVDADGEDSHESRTFDLVFWDSMGDPLFVADVDTERTATGGGAVSSLIEGARAVGTAKDTLGGAFYVTNSYFEPGALDAVGEATSGGLLSRSSKTSFVKLSRKRGYHLCLVEAREGEFHLSVPEL